MSQVIKTLETVRAADTFAIADYPSCNFFLPITETAGLILNDLAGSQDITFAPVIDATFAFAGNGVTIAGTVGMQSDGAETLPDLGSTKDIIQLVVADFNVDNATVLIGGGANDPAIKIARKVTTGISNFRDTTPTTNTLTSAAIDASTQCAAMYTVRATPRLFLVESDGAAITSPQDIALTATAGMNLNEGTGNILLGTGVKVYGVATFTFDALPSDVLAAISWMNYQWRNNNKVIYPPWKFKT